VNAKGCAALDVGDDARRAMLAARDMQTALIGHNRRRAERQQPPLKMGVGVHYGAAIAGNVGTMDHAQYTIIGDVVNLASRLESATKDHDVAVFFSKDVVAAAEEDAIGKLYANYIDNIKAYTQKGRVRNKYTGQDEEPDERLMRSIEEKIDIPDSRKDAFRRETINFLFALAVDGKKFDYRTNERLHRALADVEVTGGVDTVVFGTISVKGREQQIEVFTLAPEPMNEPAA
jgi:class 3 adenylate cyclase